MKRWRVCVKNRRLSGCFAGPAPQLVMLALVIQVNPAVLLQNVFDKANTAFVECITGTFAGYLYRCRIILSWWWRWRQLLMFVERPCQFKEEFYFVVFQYGNILKTTLDQFVARCRSAEEQFPLAKCFNQYVTVSITGKFLVCI